MGERTVTDDETQVHRALQACLDVLAHLLGPDHSGGLAVVDARGQVVAVSSPVADPPGRKVAELPGEWQPMAHALTGTGCTVYERRDGGRPDISLTRRQSQVLMLLDENLTAGAIAARLGVSVRTVHHHIELLYARLQVHDRLAALRAARRLHLLPAWDGSGPFGLPGPRRWTHSDDGATDGPGKAGTPGIPGAPGNTAH